MKTAVRTRKYEGLNYEQKESIKMDLEDACARIRGSLIVIRKNSGTSTSLYRRTNTVYKIMQELIDMLEVPDN